MKLKAVHEVYYAGRTRHVGEEFETLDHVHAMILIHQGRAVQAPNVHEKPKPELKPAEMQTASVTAEDDSDAKPNKRGRYLRRDMRPEK